MFNYMVVILSQIKFIFSQEFMYMDNMSKLINALCVTLFDSIYSFSFIHSTYFHQLHLQYRFKRSSHNTPNKRRILTNKDNELSVKAKVLFDWDLMGKQGSMTSLHNMVTIYTPKEEEFKCNFNNLKISKIQNQCSFNPELTSLVKLGTVKAQNCQLGNWQSKTLDQRSVL